MLIVGETTGAVEIARDIHLQVLTGTQRSRARKHLLEDTVDQRFPTGAPRSPWISASTFQELRDRFSKMKKVNTVKEEEIKIIIVIRKLETAF